LRFVITELAKRKSTVTSHKTSFAPSELITLFTLVTLTGYLMNNDVNEVIRHFAHFQSAVSFTHPEIVSSTMMFMGIKKSSSGELFTFEGEIDLKDVIASFEGDELNAGEE